MLNAIPDGRCTNPMPRAARGNDVSEDPDFAIAGLDLDRPSKDLAAGVGGGVGFDDLPRHGGMHGHAGGGKPVQPGVAFDAPLVGCSLRLHERELR
jgi:hypothetical protein